MAQILIAPGKYIQGPNELSNIASYVSDFGEKALCVITDSGMKRHKDIIDSSFNSTETEIVYENFNRECRLLVAGMGDALATYFEARACERSNASTCAASTTTMAAQALAKLCYETLMSEGYKAKLACDNNCSTIALEKVIEANTLLSGIGGLAAAHAIHNGLTVLPECHHMYHGEKVAFGTLVQLVLENASEYKIAEVLDFCYKVDLPITLEDLGVTEITKEKIMAVAKASTIADETIHNMPFKVTADDVYAAILVADSLGKNYK